MYAKIDMTNSFFQTKVTLEDIHLTVVSMLFGLYKWTVMPMGCRNTPVTHQRCMTSALHEHIGRICHIYINDIMIWSNTMDEHI